MTKKLVDLQSMPNDEIIKKKHVGMLEYMLKHIPTKYDKALGQVSRNVLL